MEPVVVEVRDRDLKIVGQLHQFRLKLSVVFNGVGSFELTVPAEHPLLPALSGRGAGVRISFGGRVVSGRVRSATVSQDAADPAGMWVVSGATDEERLQARATLPDPTVEPDAQAVAYYTDSGPFESVAKRLVDLNAGPGALPRRRTLEVAPDLGRGAVVRVSSRLKVLLEELAALAVTGGMGFHVVQEGAELVFECYEPVDRSRYVRMQVATGELSSSSWSYQAPSATEVLVLGQGVGENRTVLSVTDPAAEAAAADWDLRWEVVKDQRNTDDPGELAQAGTAILSEQGVEVNSVRLVPVDAAVMQVGRDWWLGDVVTVVSPAGAATARVTQVSVSYDQDGLYVLAGVGDVAGTDFESRLVASLNRTVGRVDALERSVGVDQGGAVGYRYEQTVVFESSGSFIKANYPGLRAVRFRMVGGGGGGSTTNTTSRGRGGGGAGGYAEKFVLEAELGAIETVTVGAGGSAGSSGGNTVAAGITCYGGQGAGDGGGSGGDVSGTADLAFRGSGGGSGSGNASTSWSFSGQGGDSPWGGGGRGRFSIGTAYDGQEGTGYGAGGAGGSRGSDSSNATGGAGAPGRVEVEVYV